MTNKRVLGSILVTGGDGFIGSHLVETLVKQGEDVTALCLYNSHAHLGWLEKYSKNSPPNLKTVFGDIRDIEFVQHLAKDKNTVFHLAALIAIPYSYVAPRSYIETNITGTHNIAQACLDQKVERLIQTSTSEVYGSAQTVPISESHPLQGQSPYSASKIGADKLIESYFCSFDLPATTLRPFNTYGPRQSLRAVIPTVISQILSGFEEIELGSLTPTRDFNFVLDTVNAFISLASCANEEVLGQVYNAGTGKEISIGNFVELASKVLEKSVIVKQTNERERPQKSEVNRLVSDSSKLRAITGWEPKTSLGDGILLFSEWLKPRLEKIRADIYHR